MKFLQVTFLGLMATAGAMTASAFSIAPVGRSVSAVSRAPVSVFMSELASESEPTTEPAERHTVYVGNLPFFTTQEEVSDLFTDNGISVINVSMPMEPDRIDSETGKPRSKGFCFVDVASFDMIKTAIDALNAMDMNGRDLIVNKVVPKEELQKRSPNRGKNFTPDGQKKLYVGNLPFEAEYDEIKAHFEQYGEVRDLYIPLRDNQSRGFCFITMDDEASDEAMSELNGADFLGRPLVVNEPLKKGESLPSRGPKPNQFKLYVGNLSFYTTQETLTGVFEEFGEVLDCYLPTDPNTDQPRGFGFITMDQADGEVAISELDGLELDGRFIRVNEAQGKRRRPPFQELNDGGDLNDW